MTLAMFMILAWGVAKGSEYGLRYAIIPSAVRTQVYSYTAVFGGLAFVATFVGSNMLYRINPALPFWIGSGLLALTVLGYAFFMKEPEGTTLTGADLETVGEKKASGLKTILGGLKLFSVEQKRALIIISFTKFLAWAGVAGLETFASSYVVNTIAPANPLRGTKNHSDKNQQRNMNKLKTIIVGVDLSECSRSALELAARMAEWNQANLRIIHAVEHLTISEAAEALRLNEDAIRSEIRQQAITRLAAWAGEAGAPAQHSREVIFGPPLEILLQEARTSSADLLVLGITGDSLLPYGASALATKCLRKAPCKVMLVKSSDARPFRRIVACVDFSETSREALVQAMRVAARDRGGRTVVPRPGNARPGAGS